MGFLGIVASLALACLGGVAIAAPDRVAQWNALQPQGDEGLATVRSTMGGFFLALGLFGAFAGAAFWPALGLACLGAALGRAISATIDRAFGPETLGGVTVASLLAICFFLAA